MSVGKQKKLLIIGLDGLRPDALQVADTPAIDSLASEGSYTWEAESEPVTVSGSAWTSLLTGVHLDKHRVVGNEFRWRDKAYRTFFALAREEFPNTRTVAHVNWKPIIDDIFEDDSLVVRSSGSDESVTSATEADIRDGNGDLFFVHLDDIDGAGHKHGYGPGSTGYVESIAVADARVARLVDAVAVRPESEDWLVAVVSDHGGLEKSHGNPSPEEITIAVALSENQLIPPGPIHGATPFRIVDLVPLFSRFLGLKDQDYWDGVASDSYET
jgi:predicted AlkP superfamily pyrophosphatase or phosphodiesterase